METAAAIALIERAAAPVDVFGTADAHRAYRTLASALHPDRLQSVVVEPDLRRRANDAFAKLARFFEQWCAGPLVEGRRAGYRLGSRHRRGSVATLYVDGPVVIKVPRQPSSNMLMANERAALGDLAAVTRDHDWLAPYFPVLTDTVHHLDPATQARRELNVLEALVDGFVTLADVAAAYPDGLDHRDYAWMHRRLLRAIAGAHEAGWVHAALTADNIMIQPELHGVVLAGWSFATRPGERPVATVSGSSAPELAAGEPVSFETDVYQAHALMLDMLGPRAPAPIRAFARGCMQADPPARPVAADLLGEYDDLLDRLYGARRFRPFHVPTPPMKGQ